MASLASIARNHLQTYGVATTLNYSWGFGSLAGLMLGIQIVTGIFCAMQYASDTQVAFDAVESLMRNVNNGWWLRYMHANGASMFFAIVFVHVARGLFFKSYLHNPALWISGVVLLLLMMGTAFIGYVLPWGQMSFWGATVITNLVTAVPEVGTAIAEWLWGGFSVGNSTLLRFFSLHYLLPFAIAGVTILHLCLLHTKGSSNPGAQSATDRLMFHPYFTVKDAVGLSVFLLVYMWFVFFAPNVLGHSDNYIVANPMSTPLHIVPEWYFLPFYAILRSVPDKLGGVALMIGSILVLVLLSAARAQRVKSIMFGSSQMIALFFLAFMALMFLGSKPAEAPYVVWAQNFTQAYFGILGLMFLDGFRPSKARV